MVCHHCQREYATAYYCHGHWHCYGCLMADELNSHTGLARADMAGISQDTSGARSRVTGPAQ